MVTNANDERTVLSCCKELTRIIMEHNAKGIRTTNTQHSSGNRLQRRSRLLVIIVNEFYCYFRIGLRIKVITGFQKLFLQFLIVLDDSVMYQYNRTILCTMGMRILSRWLAMVAHLV